MSPVRASHIAGTWVWRESRGDVAVLFTGRGPGGTREEVLRRVEPGAPPVAWARQVHSARVLAAGSPGEQGEGDALVTSRSGLALCAVTADCVPVLLAGPGGLAAVHAGWRGIAGGVVAAALARLAAPLSAWTAWIGPAIGACCYEVGDDVAAQVAAASSPAVILLGPAGRPHLDLHAAVRLQLSEAGVTKTFSLPLCTRCEEEWLWSYRREGKKAGRNLAVIWREAR
jgi:purine-nucleoside/S-methyl-5'-thioadenosine phosphorylase / adenosine deaminase